MPFLEAAPRTPGYCMDRAGASSTQLEPQPGWTVPLIISALDDLCEVGLASAAGKATQKSTSKGN